MMTAMIKAESVKDLFSALKNFASTPLGDHPIMGESTTTHFQETLARALLKMQDGPSMWMTPGERNLFNAIRHVQVQIEQAQANERLLEDDRQLYSHVRYGDPEVR